MEENAMYVRTIRPLIFLLVVMAVVSLACLGSSETPSPEPPPAETEPPQEPEEPEEPEEPPQPAAQEFLKEDFDGGNENWSFFVVDGTPNVPQFADDDLAESQLFTEDGLLVFDLVNKGLWVYAFYDPYEYENVSVELVAENRGVNNNNVSLICRFSEDEGWYEFNIANNGLYWIYHGIIDAEGNVIYSKLADGGSTKVKVGKEINTYKISCEERTLSLWINGVETRQYDDNKYVLRDGQVGVAVSSFNDLPVKIEVDSVEISEP
jgi:hypothetical protein